MPTKSISMQVLKRGQQVKKTVDLAEGATVKDVVSKLAQLTGTAKSSLFVAEVRNLDKVRLFSGEAPTGTFEVGGLETIEDVPEVIPVEHQVDALGVEKSLQLLDELIAAYKTAEFQASLSEFQQSFMDGQRDIRQYSVLLADVAGHAQEPVFAKWGYEATTSGRMDMYAAMQDVASDEAVKAKQLEARADFPVATRIDETGYFSLSRLCRTRSVHRIACHAMIGLPDGCLALAIAAAPHRHRIGNHNAKVYTQVIRPAAIVISCTPNCVEGVWLKLEIWAKGGLSELSSSKAWVRRPVSAIIVVCTRCAPDRGGRLCCYAWPTYKNVRDAPTRWPMTEDKKQVQSHLRATCRYAFRTSQSILKNGKSAFDAFAFASPGRAALSLLTLGPQIQATSKIVNQVQHQLVSHYKSFWEPEISLWMTAASRFNGSLLSAPKREICAVDPGSKHSSHHELSAVSGGNGSGCLIRHRLLLVLLLLAAAWVAAIAYLKAPAAMPVSTTTSAASTSTSSARIIPWCEGANVSALSLPKTGWCFCLYGGRCVDHFSCVDVPLRECQVASCGEASLEITASTASFRNIRLDSDILSVPVEYFRDVKKLADECPQHAPQLLAALLAAGRRVFVSTAAGGPGAPQPQFQCVHLYPHVSVPWLHVHTFIGSVPAEELPGSPPFAACASATVSEAAAAQHILKLAR
ncbi:unnamed protein product [Symbiodinium natans]|uniref:Uncharacterized protein n=1 Tax=Symbiodinium natans TaxID=878477 RepID=A0A812PGC1_9DINO|nr:unnamed protein product [Symbiodinium natans]